MKVSWILRCAEELVLLTLLNRILVCYKECMKMTVIKRSGRRCRRMVLSSLIELDT
jgi:hypothetical protein